MVRLQLVVDAVLKLKRREGGELGFVVSRRRKEKKAGRTLLVLWFFGALVAIASVARGVGSRELRTTKERKDVDALRFSSCPLILDAPDPRDLRIASSETSASAELPGTAGATLRRASRNSSSCAILASKCASSTSST